MEDSNGARVGALSSSAGGGSGPCLLPPQRCSVEASSPPHQPLSGIRPGLILSRVLLGGLRHGHNCGLLHKLLTSSLLGAILVRDCRLSCSQANNVARIDI